MNIIRFILNLFRKKKTGRGTGLVEDPVDFRDIPMEAIFKKDVDVPEEYNVPYILPKHNQGNTPICVGENGAVIKSEKERREGNDIAFDPQWLYDRCKEIDGAPKLKGTYFRAVFKVLLKTGAKPLKEKEFEKYRIGGYVKVKANFDDIKRAIYEHGVVLVGFHISNEGWSQANIRKPYRNERVYGHAVACVGYTKDKIKFQNSWGSGWGDKGYGYFDKDNMCFSAWSVIVDLPNNFKELLESYKKKPHYFFKNNLWRGLKNDEVRILQDCLKSLGCFDPSIPSTGWFGPVTLEAVKVYQMRKGIQPVSGYFGILTRTAMNKDLNMTGKL